MIASKQDPAAAIRAGGGLPGPGCADILTVCLPGCRCARLARTGGCPGGVLVSKPAILAVEDDPVVAAAITRDLRGHYSGNYLVVRATSGRKALAVLAGLALRDQPRTEWLGPDVVRDGKGLLATGQDLVSPGFAPRWPLPRAPFALETSVPGVFAVGDVRLDFMKRVASAVGEGAMSVYFVHRYLATI